jgi:IS5 family transposase
VDFSNQRARKAGCEVDEVLRAKNSNKSKIRSRVEHVLSVVKRLLGFDKVRYRALAKNATRAFVTLAMRRQHLSREATTDGTRSCIADAKRANGLLHGSERAN